MLFKKFSPPKNSKNVLQKQAFLFLSDYPAECTQTPTGVNQEMKKVSHCDIQKHVNMCNEDNVYIIRKKNLDPDEFAKE